MPVPFDPPFNPATDAIMHGAMRGAHGQEGGLLWAWVCDVDPETGEEQDFVLIHDVPRMIDGACPVFNMDEEDPMSSIRAAIRRDYLSPEWDGDRYVGIKMTYDWRARYLGREEG